MIGFDYMRETANMSSMSDETQEKIDRRLRKAIRSAVENEVDWEVSEVDFKAPFDMRSERDTLHVTLFFKLLDKPFSGHILRDAKRAAAESLREQGETRFPLIFPRLSSKQKVASF